MVEDDVAILRVEQIYPFPEDDLAGALSAYPNPNELTWVQEEPLNQGVLRYNCNHHMRNVIDVLKNDVELTKVAREASASLLAICRYISSNNKSDY